MNDTKNCVRMADRIRESLKQLRYGRYLELNRQMTTLTDRLQQLTAESRKMRASIARGWLSAAHTCCDNLCRLLGEIEYSVPRVRPLAEKPQKDIPTLLVLVDELDALQQEFGDIELDASKNTLSVVTEPITLDDIYLGPFRIQLEFDKLEQLYHRSPYSVIALEPNPAATNDSVTHPHVSDEKLCEGEGCAAIRSALEEGRICDFFTIVRSILNTYSADSPYVRLDDWDGRVCYDCGRSKASQTNEIPPRRSTRAQRRYPASLHVE